MTAIDSNTHSEGAKEPSTATFTWPLKVRGTKSVRTQNFDIEEEKMYMAEQAQERVLFCEWCGRKLPADHVHSAIFDLDGGLVHYLCFRCLGCLLNFISPELET